MGGSSQECGAGSGLAPGVDLGDSAQAVGGTRLDRLGFAAVFVVSLDAIKAFAALVHADSDLQAHVKGASSANEVVALAATHGHQFSKATLLREHAKALHAADDHALEGINSWGDALMHAFGASARD